MAGGRPAWRNSDRRKLLPANWPQLRLALHPRAPQYQTDADLERWRDYLKDLARALLLVLAVMFISAVTVALMAR